MFFQSPIGPAIYINYVKYLLQSMLESIDVPLEKLKFVKGTEYQLSRYVCCQIYVCRSLVNNGVYKESGTF